LQSVYNKMKRSQEKSLINNDIKNILEEFKQSSKDEILQNTYNQESQKVFFLIFLVNNFCFRDK
jgi:hypothetical protein